jgi:hypothetical protein
LPRTMPPFRTKPSSRQLLSEASRTWRFWNNR